MLKNMCMDMPFVQSRAQQIREVTKSPLLAPEKRNCNNGTGFVIKVVNSTIKSNFKTK